MEPLSVSSETPAAPAVDRLLVGAARASWVLVCGGVGVLGALAFFKVTASPPPELLGVVALLSLLGIGLGGLVRSRAGTGPLARHATMGAAASAVVLLVLGAGAASGLASAHSYARATAEVERASAAAPGEAASWYGRTAVGPLQVFALEVDGAGALGKMLAGAFARPFVPLVVGVNNQAGTRPIAVDLTDARLMLANGTSVAPLDRGEVLASARTAREQAQRLHGGHYLAPPGQALGNALVFVSPETRLADVVGVVVQIDGAAVTIPGRHLTAAEKKAAGF